MNKMGFFSPGFFQDFVFGFLHFECDMPQGKFCGILLGILQPSCIFVPITNFGKFKAIITSNIYLAPFSLLLVF
jgi:hypothetical protein